MQTPPVAGLGHVMVGWNVKEELIKHLIALLNDARIVVGGAGARMVLVRQSATMQKKIKKRRQSQPTNAGSFSGLTLDCSHEETMSDYCDGREAMVKELGWSRSYIDDGCNDDPGATCFAKVCYFSLIIIS